MAGVRPQWWSQNGSTTAALTNASLQAAPGAGQSLFITDIHISNEGAANTITLLDGSGGTALYGTYFPVNTFDAISLKTPIKLTANTALCVTTTANDHCFVMVGGYTERA